MFLLSLVLVYLSPSAFASSGKKFDDPALQRYLKSCELGEHPVLAIDKKGAWGVSAHASLPRAKTQAVEECADVSLRFGTCKVIDVNCASAFISKKRGNKTTTASTSASAKVWCAHPSHTSNVFLTTKAYCKSRQLKSFPTEAEAQIARHRVEKQTTASTSGSNMAWCTDASHIFQLTKADCKSRKLKSFPTWYQAKAEYERLRGSVRWCANKYRFWSLNAYQSSCDSGKEFQTRQQAQAEHQRLKKKTTTASSSSYGKVWCANRSGIVRVYKSACITQQNAQTAYATKAEAEAAYQRLRLRVTTTSTSGSNTVWCADVPIFHTTQADCKSRNLKGFPTKSQAQAENERLRGSVRWCANKYRYWSLNAYQSSCDSGKEFQTRQQAQAEHQRLKKKTTTASSSSYGKVWCANRSGIVRVYKSACITQQQSWNAQTAYATKAEAEAAYQRLRFGITTASTTGSNSGWCATSRSVFEIGYPELVDHCRSEGKAFATKNEAQAEHLRLKGIATATAPQPTPQAEPEPIQTITVDNSALDLAFWQSIKDSNDTDMYREYLRQFPAGVYAGLAKIKIKKLGGDTQVVNASIPNLDYGDYYALVIGNNEYPGLSNLRSAVGDARAVSNVLEVDYGFKVDHLENATRSQILRSIAKLRANVTSKDNVLIYYAGHGHLDQAADEGYWLPIDADRSDQSNWIATDRIVSQVKAMKAKHVMVVADSCFSGTITRAIKIEQRTPEWLSEIVKKKARTALTSGGLEPVMDTGSGNHSAFAYAFISLLEENDGVLDASQLFSKLRPKVMVNSTQTPQYGKIHMAGDDGGDFLFVRQ
jgi:hypothetical protein